MATINFDKLIGKPLSDSNILMLLSHMKKDPAKIKMKKGDIDFITENEKIGIQLTFLDIEGIRRGLVDPNIEISPILLDKLNYMENLPEGSLFLADLDQKQTKNTTNQLVALPSGMFFGMDKQTVYRILGTPTLGEREKFNTAGWIFEYYKYAARFTKDDILFSFGVHFIEHSHLMKF